MDEVLYEVLYGGMEWMVRMDVMLMLMLMLIVKRKSIHFYLGRDGLKMREGELLPWFQI